VDPALGVVGGFPVYTYPLAVNAGTIVGLVGMLWLARRAGLPAGKILDAAIVTVVAALVGARAAYVALHVDEYSFSPLASLYFWEGGLSLLGAITIGALAAPLWLRRTGLPVGRTLDAAAPGVALGQAIGALGCLTSGCAAGVVPPMQSRLPVLALPNAGGAIAPRFPSALAESAACLALGLLLFVVLRGGAPAGVTAALYLAGYGLVRLLAEPFREDSEFWGPFAAASWWAGCALLLGSTLAWRAVRSLPQRAAQG